MKSYHSPQDLRRFFQRADLRDDQILTNAANLVAYSYDNSRRSVRPEIVLLPESHDEVQQIVQICHDHEIPLTVRGRGSGTSGASVPTQSGVVLSTEQMRKIVRLDLPNRMMTVQPGITNQEVQTTAAKHGFFWAPDPSSSAFCSVGGNLACGTAGPRAVKYGTVRENIFGLRAITGTGEEIKTGTETTKWAVGYDLTRLLLGSEGTLAVITEATLKLLPKPQAKRMARILFRDIHTAAEAIAAIMAQPTPPCALEFMDRKSIDLIRPQLGNNFPEQANAMLMVEVDGTKTSLDDAVSKIDQCSNNAGRLEFCTATNSQETKILWQARKILSPRLREIAPKKINEDIVVPVSELPELISRLDQLAQQHQLQIVNFGHAGNGNLHTNLLVNPDNLEEMERAETALAEIFKTVLELRGSISGEHGIGLVKQPFVPLEIGETERKLMNGIRTVFDPKGILNPDKGPQL